MTKGKFLIGVVALTLFFVVGGLVHSFFQFPEDKVKYDLLFVRVEGSCENFQLTIYGLALICLWSQRPISHGRAFHCKFTCENTNQIHSLVLIS